MKNKPSKLERVLSSIVLASALLFPIKAKAESPKIEYSPQTIEPQSQTPQSCTGIFEKEAILKTQSFNELDNLELRDYQNLQSYENPILRKKALEGLNISAEKIDWIKELKDNVSELTDYKLYEPNKQNSESVVEKGKKWFEIDATAGVKTYLGKKNIPAGELYADFNRPSILGYDLKKARISLNNRGELELQMQKKLDSDWLGEIRTQASYSGLDRNISISKELKKSKSRVKITAGEEKQKGTFLELDYRILY